MSNVMNQLAAAVGLGNANQMAQNVIAQGGTAFGPGGLQNIYGSSPQSRAELTAHKKDQMRAKADVLEFFESQLNMDLFKDKLLAKTYFEQAIDAAIERLMK